MREQTEGCCLLPRTHAKINNTKFNGDDGTFQRFAKQDQFTKLLILQIKKLFTFRVQHFNNTKTTCSLIGWLAISNWGGRIACFFHPYFRRGEHVPTSWELTRLRKQ